MIGIFQAGLTEFQAIFAAYMAGMLLAPFFAMLAVSSAVGTVRYARKKLRQEGMQYTTRELITEYAPAADKLLGAKLLVAGMLLFIASFFWYGDHVIALIFAAAGVACIGATVAVSKSKKEMAMAKAKEGS